MNYYDQFLASRISSSSIFRYPNEEMKVLEIPDLQKHAGKAEFNGTGIQKPLYYFKNNLTFREFFTIYMLSS